MTKQSNDTLPLVLALVVTLGLLGGGFWFFGRGMLSIFGNSDEKVDRIRTPGENGSLGGSSDEATPDDNPAQSPSPAPSSQPALSLDTSLPNPSVLTIDGSVSMVALIKQLQTAYIQINPTIPTTYGVPDGKPNGTNAGLQNLANGTVAIAASSRPLTPTEIQSGLQAVPVARDALAVVVGVDNTFKGGLTLAQLRQIFQGQITNWSQVGGADLPIQVINRSPDSGTYSFFQEAVLLGGIFAPDGPNFTTLPRDETTPMLRALGNNGIGYSTVQQVANQQTVRIVPIDGMSPTDVGLVTVLVFGC